MIEVISMDSFDDLVQWFGDNPVLTWEQLTETTSYTGYYSSWGYTGSSSQYKAQQLPLQITETKTIYKPVIHTEPLMAWSVLLMGCLVLVTCVRRLIGRC